MRAGDDRIRITGNGRIHRCGARRGKSVCVGNGVSSRFFEFRVYGYGRSGGYVQWEYETLGILRNETAVLAEKPVAAVKVPAVRADPVVDHGRGRPVRSRSDAAFVFPGFVGIDEAARQGRFLRRRGVLADAGGEVWSSTVCGIARLIGNGCGAERNGNAVRGFTAEVLRGRHPAPARIVTGDVDGFLVLGPRDRPLVILSVPLGERSRRGTFNEPAFANRRGIVDSAVRRSTHAGISRAVLDCNLTVSSIGRDGTASSCDAYSALRVGRRRERKSNRGFSPSLRWGIPASANGVDIVDSGPGGTTGSSVSRAVADGYRTIVAVSERSTASSCDVDSASAVVGGIGESESDVSRRPYGSARSPVSAGWVDVVGSGERDRVRKRAKESNGNGGGDPRSLRVANRPYSQCQIGRAHV